MPSIAGEETSSSQGMIEDTLAEDWLQSFNILIVDLCLRPGENMIGKAVHEALKYTAKVERIHMKNERIRDRERQK